MRNLTQKIHSVLTLSLAFSLPLDRQIPPLVIVLLALNWLVEGNWKEKISNYKIHKVLLLPCLLYFLYCLGMLYSENIEFGMKDLEIKLSLLILPLIFASKPSFKKDEINKIFHYFTVGCGLAIILCLAHSAFLYYNEIRQVKNGTLHDTYTNMSFFFSSNLSYFIHPSYFAMYLNVCIIYMFSIFVSAEGYLLIQKKNISIILITFSITIAFLASKMGILVLLLIWLWVICFVVVKKKNYFTGIGSLLVIAAVSLLLYRNSEIIASKVDDTLKTLETKNLDKTSFESSTVRVLIWRQAIDLIKENSFIGVGTGDIKDELLERYKTAGMIGALDHKLNAHNQFLQTGIALGIPGLLFIGTILLIPMLHQRNRHFLLIGFIVITILNFSVESMLEIQAGTIFFSFFNSVLLLYNKDHSL